jgi:protein ImuB
MPALNPTTLAALQATAKPPQRKRPRPSKASERATSEALSDSLWLGIELPFLSAELAAEQAQVDGPIAVYHDVAGHPVIYQACPKALKYGVSAGMKLSAARALCHGLHSAPRQADQEQKALKSIAQKLWRVSNQLQLTESGLCLEIGRSKSLFGDVQAAKQQALQQCTPFSLVSSLAPSPLAASLISQLGYELEICDQRSLRRWVSHLPLSALQKPVTEKRLAKLGLETLGELQRLPRPDLSRRFGRDVVSRLDALIQQRLPSQKLYSPPAYYSQNLDLACEIDGGDILLTACSTLLEQFAKTLREKAANSSSFTIRLFHLHHSASVLSLSFLQASNHSEHWQKVVNEKLDRLDLPAKVISLELSSEHIVHAQAGNVDLFSSSAGKRKSLPQTLEFVGARLGSQSIQRPAWYADHRPEKSTGLEPVAIKTASFAGTQLDRPTFLYPKAIGLKRPPQKMGLEIFGKPERIQSGWWDQQPVDRDYYHARDRYGRQIWLYRENQGWFVQGLFS